MRVTTQNNIDIKDDTCALSQAHDTSSPTFNFSLLASQPAHVSNEVVPNSTPIYDNGSIVPFPPDVILYSTNVTEK